MISTLKGHAAAAALITAALLIGLPQASAAATPADVAATVAAAPGHTLYGDPAVPDVSGLWISTYAGARGFAPQQPIDEQDTTFWAPWPAPLTPAYRKMSDDRIAAAKAGRAVGDIGARCLPWGLPRMLMNGFYTDEIIQTPGVVSIFKNSTFPIMIWTDGRPHPADLKPSYNGHSIGHWIGDTLFVDTVGVMSTTPIEAGARTPHSSKLHMKWDLQLVDKDTVHIHVTLYDEDAYTEPMVTTAIWRRKAGPEWQELDDSSCFENNRNIPEAAPEPGFTHF